MKRISPGGPESSWGRSGGRPEPQSSQPHWKGCNVANHLVLLALPREAMQSPSSQTSRHRREEETFFRGLMLSTFMPSRPAKSHVVKLIDRVCLFLGKDSDLHRQQRCNFDTFSPSSFGEVDSGGSHQLNQPLWFVKEHDITKAN